MTIREMPAAPCAICGKPAHAHTGSEMFCPIYATYRAASLGPFESSTSGTSAIRLPDSVRVNLNAVEKL